MQMTMSMFASSADYWKARAELAEATISELAKELECKPQEIIPDIDFLRLC